MIALFGGTFDPIHLGHLNMAKQCVQELALDTLYFLPCAIPVHKAQPKITTRHRLDMLQAAIDDCASLQIDDRELRRKGRSYSLLSLQECRNENPATPLIFLMGMDSFNSLSSWYEWQAITQLCHIVVFQRPGETLMPNNALSEYLKYAQTQDKAKLHLQTAGLCYFLSGHEFDAASSSIRELIKNQQATEHLLPGAVSQYIQQHQLYAD